MRGVGGPPELFCTQAIWDHETGVALDFEVTSDKRQARVSDLGSRNLGSRATSDEQRVLCPKFVPQLELTGPRNHANLPLWLNYTKDI